MAPRVADFYDALAEDSGVLLTDWDSSIEHHARIVDSLLQSRRAARGTLLDCACGIGTHALGLARLGWRVHATDLSPGSVARAEREARGRSLDVTASVADIRRLGADIRGSFDAVICCNNAIAQLITDADLRAGLDGMHERLVPGGVLLLALRDYDVIQAERPVFASERVIEEPGVRRVVFQLWEWAADGRSYVRNNFLLQEGPGGWRTANRTAPMRALRRKELDQFLEEAGFADVRWHAVADTGYHLPVVTALRP